MFDNTRKYKIAGSIIIVALLAVYLLFNINIKLINQLIHIKINRIILVMKKLLMN